MLLLCRIHKYLKTTYSQQQPEFSSVTGVGYVCTVFLEVAFEMYEHSEHSDAVGEKARLTCQWMDQ